MCMLTKKVACKYNMDIIYLICRGRRMPPLHTLYVFRIDLSKAWHHISKLCIWMIQILKVACGNIIVLILCEFKPTFIDITSWWPRDWIVKRPSDSWNIQKTRTKLGDNFTRSQFSIWSYINEYKENMLYA